MDIALVALITGALAVRIKKLIVQGERAKDCRVNAIRVDDQTVLELYLLTELAGQSLNEVIYFDDALTLHQVGQIVFKEVDELENVLALDCLLIQIAVRMLVRMAG